MGGRYSHLVRGFRAGGGGHHEQQRLANERGNTLGVHTLPGTAEKQNIGVCLVVPGRQKVVEWSKSQKKKMFQSRLKIRAEGGEAGFRAEQCWPLKMCGETRVLSQCKQL